MPVPVFFKYRDLEGDLNPLRDRSRGSGERIHMRTNKMNVLRYVPRFRKAPRELSTLAARESWSRGDIEALRTFRGNVRPIGEEFPNRGCGQQFLSLADGRVVCMSPNMNPSLLPRGGEGGRRPAEGADQRTTSFDKSGLLAQLRPPTLSFHGTRGERGPLKCEQRSSSLDVAERRKPSQN
jgi:hypothetical protein